MNTNMATINNHNTDSYLNEKQTVLIVDDSKVIRLALNKILKNDFTVIQANDGEEAWEKLLEYEAILAVFSDVSMPNLDGFGLLDRVRTASEARIAELPFIIITANDDDPDFSSKVANAGGNDLITKPFKTDEIKSCIQNHINVEPTPIATDTTAPSMPDQEVAEILGFDDVEPTAYHEPIAEDINSNAMEFTIDEDFFESSNDVPHDEAPELTAEAHAVEEPTHQISTMGDIDLDMEFNEDVSASTDSYVDEFVFTIDEDFLNTSLEEGHKEVTDTVSHSTDSVEIESLTTTLKTETPAAPKPPLELSLEDTTAETGSITENTVVASESHINMEQARQHATEIALEKDYSTEDSTESSAKQTTEREQIRARLQQIREQEKQDIANIREARRIGSNSTSLFSKLGRIISGLFVFRKK